MTRDNHRALELAKDAHYLKHCLSGWGAGGDNTIETESEMVCRAIGPWPWRISRLADS